MIKLASRISKAAIAFLCVLALAVSTQETAVAATVDPGAPIAGIYQYPGKCTTSGFPVKTTGTPNMCLIFTSWSPAKKFPTATVKAAKARGVSVMISWQPWSAKLGKRPQPKYSLKNIAAGKLDTYVKSWAKAAAATNTPVYMRFAHEMNGPWYPWGFGINNNRAVDYIKAWRHVHQVFVDNGATNVVWVWAPNTLQAKNRLTLKSFYPGDDYVDLVGPVGYGRRGYATYKSVFGPTIKAVKALTKKPIIISEVGAFNKLPTKQAFIKDFFTNISKDKTIVGFVWFNSNHPRSLWRLKGTADLKAYKAGLAQFLKSRGK